MRRWMRRGSGPEAQPIRLPQRRIYVLPTATGWSLFITLAVMLIASLNYNLSLGYMLTFLLGGVFVVHMVQSWRALLGLEIALRPQGEVFAGGTAAFLVELRDDSGRERIGITVGPLDEDHATGHHVSIDVAAHAMGSELLRLPAPRRGWHAVGRLRVECRAPLGWVRAWSYIEPDAQAIVYPQAIDSMAPPPAPGPIADQGVSQRPGREEFAGLRSYQPSDSPRQIAWKQLARGGPMMSKQFVGGTGADLVFDWASLPAHMNPEMRLSQLTAWVVAARHRGLATTLRLPNRELGPGRTPRHHEACLQALALFGDPRH